MSLLLACPRDVRRLILSWLDARSLLRFAQTCQAARTMAEEPHLWRLLCLSGQERAAQRRIERESHRDWKAYFVWSRQAHGGAGTFEDFVTAQAESTRNLEAGMRMLGRPGKERHAQKCLELAFRFNPTSAMYERLYALFPELTMQHGYWEHLTRLRIARERSREEKRVDEALEELVQQMHRDALYVEADRLMLGAFRRHPDAGMARRIRSVAPSFGIPDDPRWAAAVRSAEAAKSRHK